MMRKVKNNAEAPRDAHCASGERLVSDATSSLYGEIMFGHAGAVRQDAADQCTISSSGKTIDAGAGSICASRVLAHGLAKHRSHMGVIQ
jgi:hypothetical protein